MSSVEDGVRRDFGKWGIKEPETTLECLAVKLAQLLDEMRAASDQKNASPATLARELRMTMTEIESQHRKDDNDKTQQILDKER
jgi:hypothetical protein